MTSVITPRFFLPTFAVVLMVATALAPPASAGGITWPPEFAGIWETTSTTRDCVTQIVLNQGVDVDTLCTGDTFDPGDESGGKITCEGTINADVVDILCSGAFEVNPGCMAEFTIDEFGTRTGETWEILTTIETVFIGDCGPVPDQCIEVLGSAIRVAGPPETCPVPVEPTSWGQIKASYDR